MQYFCYKTLVFAIIYLFWLALVQKHWGCKISTEDAEFKIEGATATPIEYKVSPGLSLSMENVM